MKKILMALTIVISCLGISRVKAETYNLVHSNTYEYATFSYYSDYDYVKKMGYDGEIQELYNLLINEYNLNYNSEYPYYIFTYHLANYNNCDQSDNSNCISEISLFLQLYKEKPSYTYNHTDGYYTALPIPDLILESSYDVIEKLYILPLVYSSNLNISFIVNYSMYNEFAYFISNFDLINNTEDTFIVTGNSNFTINPGDVIKPYYNAGNAFKTNYTEINLNDYAYVVLSLKDYNQEPFSTQVYVKGNYCLTPVYNYGMTERKDVLTGSQVDRCSPYYDTYTPVRTYILESDLKNHAIYYLKAYDISKDNYVKVDTSVFDITYITEENKDKPYVPIDGKIYPTIPYDDLNDTSTKSEDEGYVSGAVEEFSFSDIFTAPLDFLKDVWSSITSVFSLITELLSLLPPIMQNFLYASFMLAVVIGLIKIIL